MGKRSEHPQTFGLAPRNLYYAIHPQPATFHVVCTRYPPLLYFPHMEFVTGILPYVQIALSIILVTGILLQRSEAGLGSAFGGEVGGAYHTRRGFEKILFRGTIIVGAIFVLASAAAFIVR